VGGQAAAHAGRFTVRVRDFDFVQNLVLTSKSGSENNPGMMTEAATAAKVKGLEEAVASRKRKRGKQ
jgi:hypothetical protein